MLFDVLIAGHLRKNGIRSLVSVAAVALGVAISTIFGLVDSTTDASLATAFRSIDSTVNLQVLGSSHGFDERVVARIRQIEAVRAARPVVQGQIALVQQQ